MYIKRLEIKGFGKFNDLQLDFNCGLNMIFGYNESGKSTLQAFIKGMLYGLKGGRAGKDGVLPPLKRYKPWKGADYQGSLEYCLDNNRVFKVVRDFNKNTIKVLDASFNDITHTFDLNRENGVLFAENHLGMNDACFEKTVFIKQLETKFSEDGNRELLNRLANFNSTGFEDISFNRAQDALKEALKQYVGTEKTSTRPLDKVHARLKELQDARSIFLERRGLAFSKENDLDERKQARERLERKKALLTKVKWLINLKEKLFELRNKHKELDELLKEAIDLEDEHLSVSGRLEEYKEEQREFEDFESFNTEDADSVSMRYQKLLLVLKEQEKIQSKIKHQKEQLEETERKLERLNAFRGLGEHAGEELDKLVHEAAQLRAELSSGNMNALNDQIEHLQGVLKRKGFIAAAAGILAVAALVTGFARQFLAGHITALVMIFLTFLSLYDRFKEVKRRSNLLREKNIASAAMRSATEDIAKKQGVIDQLLQAVGASNTDEFFSLKAVYDGTTPKLISICNELNRQESELVSNEQYISILKSDLTEKLFAAGIWNGRDDEISEDHINRFRQGIRRYRELDAEIKYLVQRQADLSASIQSLYRKTVAICKEECTCRQVLIEQLDRMSQEVDEYARKLQAGLREIQDDSYPYDDISIEDITADIINENSNKLPIITAAYEEELDKTCQQMNDCVLDIKENEILLKNLLADEESIQRVDEELAELECRKNQLEDINKSLKLALDVLTEASIEIQRSSSPRLSQNMSRIIKRVTRERYSDIRADDRLDIKTVVPETGDVVSALSLSGGTIDQMYLALRLSMADMISREEEKLPLILDEIFSQYDDTRTEETMAFLDELGHERQIIIFTCKNREVEIARKVCGDTLNVIELK